MRARRALFPVLALGLLLVSASAQETTKSRIDTARQKLDNIEQTLQRQGLDQGALAGLRGEVDGAVEALGALTGEIEPQLRDMDERLKQLGQPDAGQTEAPEITKERDDIKARHATADADIRQVKLQQVRADQLSERIADRRRDLLTRQLFERSYSILDPTLWKSVGNAFPRLAISIGYFISDWFSILGSAGHALGFVVLGLTVLLAITLYGPMRRRLLALPQSGALRWGTSENPTPVQRSLMALWTGMVNAFLPAAAAYLVVEVLSSLDLVPVRFGVVADAVVHAVVIFSGLRAVAEALLAPGRPRWRFLDLSDKVALSAYRGAVAVSTVIALFLIVQNFNAAIVAALPINVAALGLFSLAFAAALALGLARVANLETGEREERLKDPYSAPERRAPLWRWLRLLLWGAAFAIIGAAAFGYVAFAAFLSHQVVWDIIVGGTLIVLLRLVDDIVSEVTRAGSATARKVANTLGIETNAVEQAGILTSGLARVMLLLLGVFLFIAPWGVDSRDAVSVLRTAFFGLHIGGITISLANVLAAALIFTLGLIATRGVRRWLDNRLLPATRMDIGLRNSISTTLGYVGFIIAAGIGFTFLGVDVQNLAIVAGALSVGIGFGLQSIVSNFVSGLILLVERPIKAGDMIVVAGAEGYVRKINVRATEIETFDKAVMIVPNSSLVSSNVKNWMHNDLLGRANIKIGVPYGTDVEKVRDLLLDIAKSHPLVICDPDPKVFLIDFTDLAMVFELGCIVGNVDKSYSVKSDLRFEIARRFALENIQIR